MAPVALPYEGRAYIADTSAWVRTSHPDVKDEWAEALRARQIATCPIVKMELLYSAQSGADYDQLDEMLAVLRDVPITRSVTNAALAALRQLAHVQPRYQRSVRFPDLLTAATAQDAGIGVLHYDRHFDELSNVLRFESRWIGPSGTL